VRLHHIAFRTDDLARLEAFYAGTLGLTITKRDGTRSVWLASADVVLMLEQRGRDEPHVPAGTMEMLAFAISADERALYTQRLAAAGIAVESQTPFTLYVRDPDGRRVGLSHYTFT
jgi:glyoxylase I family protein